MRVPSLGAIFLLLMLGSPAASAGVEIAVSGEPMPDVVAVYHPTPSPGASSTAKLSAANLVLTPHALIARAGDTLQIANPTLYALTFRLFAESDGAAKGAVSAKEVASATAEAGGQTELKLASPGLYRVRAVEFSHFEAVIRVLDAKTELYVAQPHEGGFALDAPAGTYALAGFAGSWREQRALELDDAKHAAALLTVDGANSGAWRWERRDEKGKAVKAPEKAEKPADNAAAPAKAEKPAKAPVAPAASEPAKVKAPKPVAKPKEASKPAPAPADNGFKVKVIGD